MTKLNSNCSNQSHIFRQANHVGPMLFGKLLLVATWLSISVASKFKFKFHNTGNNKKSTIKQMAIYYAEGGRSKGMVVHSGNPQEDFIIVETECPHLIRDIELFLSDEKLIKPTSIPELKPNQFAAVEVVLEYHDAIQDKIQDEWSTVPLLERSPKQRCVLQ